MLFALQTTTIGKLAFKLNSEGARVYVVPGDTFRAAAAEQLAEWARRASAAMGPFQEGAPPQAVIAQCCADAASRGDIDIIICDTAGRLHTAYELMEELEVGGEAAEPCSVGVLCCSRGLATCDWRSICCRLASQQSAKPSGQASQTRHCWC